MKRVVFILVLFIFSCSIYKPPIAQAAPYTDPTQEDHAYALDVARGYDKERYTEAEIEAIKKNYPNFPYVAGDLKCPSAAATQNNTTSDQKANQEGALSAASQNMGWDLTGLTIGIGKTNCTDGRQVAFFNNSAIGTTGTLIASMYSNPPASGVYYAYDLLHNAGLVKPAYAQGIGFSGLTPILPIWKAFRNISYVIIVIVLIAIGFMIMFRMKINPQTVISIQSALPNIVITLILITFSYAIAGLMIDLMYFAMSLVITIMLGSGFSGWQNTPGGVSSLQQFYLNANMGTLFKAIVPQQTMTALPAAIFGLGWHLFEENATSQNPLWAKILLVLPALGASIATGITGVIGMILIALTLLFSFVRIFIILLNSYIQVILAIILAPFQLLIGAIPGKSMFRNWLLGLIGNLAVFPTLVFIILVAGGFSNLAGTQTTTSTSDKSLNLWVAPFITGPSSSNPGLVTGLIALGFIILTPSLLNAVKGAFQAKPILPISPGMIMQPVLGGGQTVLSTAMQISYLKNAGTMLPGKIGDFFRGPPPKIPPKIPTL